MRKEFRNITVFSLFLVLVVLPINSNILYLNSSENEVIPHNISGTNWEVDRKGLVTYIVDGDTFDIDTDDRIRLADVDTPEYYESGYQEAKDYLSALINGEKVYLDIDDIYQTGPYGRLICVVYVPYSSTHLLNVNMDLLVQGLADIADYDNEFDPSEWSLYVKDTELPTWDNFPGNQVVEFGNSFLYDLDASDNVDINSFWINDTNQFEINHNGVIRNINALSVGTYWLNVEVNDTFSNSISSVFKIIVHDTTAPNWNPVPPNQVIKFGSSFRYKVNAWDLSGVDSFWINDTTHFQIDANGVITNISSLENDIYWIKIGVNDTYGNYKINTFKIDEQSNSNVKNTRSDNSLIIGLMITLFGVIVPLLVIIGIYFMYNPIKSKFQEVKKKLKNFFGRK